MNPPQGQIAKPETEREPTGSAVAAGGDLILTFDDNRLVPRLFGRNDQHLALIEERLGVEVMPRGNCVAIVGRSDARENARRVLSSLYERLSEGFEVHPADVDGAIRLHAAPEVNADSARESFGTPKDARIRIRRKLVVPRSHRQGRYVLSLQNGKLVFGVGPAGTGKTYLAIACAAAALMAGEVDRIVLSRPAVEAGERLGFLPGDMKEKVDPYLRPLYDALYDVMPANLVRRGVEDETIEIAPLAFMRGRTLVRAFAILDEAQNCTPQQMKMFLTRLGEGSRMAVTGDPTQVDLPRGVNSGLSEAAELLGGIDDVDVVRFDSADIVRHPLVTKIVDAYEAAGARPEATA